MIDDLYVYWLKEVGITVTVTVIALDEETLKSLDTLQSRLNKSSNCHSREGGSLN